MFMFNIRFIHQGFQSGPVPGDMSPLQTSEIAGSTVGN